MELLSGILLCFFCLFIFLIFRLLTTFIHEMGHAIPSLLFTDELVTIYIGSYGDISNSAAVRIGRLQIFLRFKVFSQTMGLCAHENAKYLWQEFLIIIGGPSFSVLLSLPLIWILATTDLSRNWTMVLLTFIISAVLDFFVNIIPNSNRMVLHNGKVTYNDGYQMIRLLSQFSKSEQVTELEKLYYEAQHETVIAKGQKYIAESKEEKAIYDLIIKSMLAQQNYNNALQFYEKKQKVFDLDVDDYYQLGKIHTALKNYDEALTYFEKYKYRHFQDSKVLNDMGFVKLKQKNYEAAIKDLDAAIFYAAEYLDAYLYRGAAKIKLGLHDEAHTDFQKAKVIDKNDKRIPYYFGLYYEAKRDYTQALDFYELAKRRRLEGYNVEEKIESMKR